jgi:probable selenium-dependent hydroxylase accessory protein YqeC
MAMDLWDAIGFKEPKILACTGAGGKTSVVLTLARQAQLRHLPVLLSTTAKMYYAQVSELNPVFSGDFAEGAASVAALLQSQGIAAWFGGRQGDKVSGLPLQWLDKMSETSENPFILVEADGARGKWLKSPAVYEPIVPSRTAITVGVLNLQAVGQPFTKQIVHRLELVLQLVQKQENELITWRDLALLATAKQGIFQHSQGKKILLLAGADCVPNGIAGQIAEYLDRHNPAISQCIVMKGYGANLQPAEVHTKW